MKEVAKEFKKAIIKEFDGYLKAIGFKKVRHRTDDISFSITYRQEERYISFGSSLHPRDYPLYFFISLGEGSNDLLGSGWNCIPLDLIIKNANSSDFEKSKDVFSIDFGITHDEIAKKVKASRQLLERYGQSFMNNDLRQFKKLRAEYKTEYERQNIELKKKYSK